jgi:cytoskeletal protein CcmA (bactofilin family)
MAFNDLDRGTLSHWQVLWRGLVILGFVPLLIGVPTSHVSGQSNPSEREDVVLEGSYTDMQFLAGRSVHIKADVADDVFAAARHVTFDGATAENAIAAGYDVELRGGTVADMITAAATISIAGAIEDDLVAAARSMRIASDGVIGGDARLAAETIDMEGRINGSLRAAARRITVAGDIGGKADFLAERIVIGPEASIAGDLIYRSEVEPEIADGATIEGEVRRVETDMPDLTSVGFTLLRVGLVIMLSWAIAMMLLVAAIQLAFPGLMTDAVNQLRTHPWSNLGRGIAVMLLAGILAGLLFASVLGVPLGAALAMTIAVLALLGLVAASYCIGLVIGRRGGADVQLAGRVGWAIAGAVILGVVALIPLIGGLVVALAIAAGFGAASSELWKRLRTA